LPPISGASTGIDMNEMLLSMKPINIHANAKHHAVNQALA
jgi:hypothetical protein